MGPRSSHLLYVVAVSLALFVGLLTPPASAAEFKSPTFAIIDVQKILRESTAVKGLTARIEEQRQAYQAELRKKEETMRAADQELARQRAILTADAYVAKRKELETQMAGLQREVRERKRALDQAFAQGMNRIQSELATVAAEIANENGLDLVLSKATVVIVKPEFEFTAEALKRLNAHLPEAPAPDAQN